MLKRMMLFVCVMLVAFGCSGCVGCVDTACLVAMPVITTGQAYAQDAQIALDQAAAAIAAMPLTNAQKQQADYAIDKARVSLRVAQQLLAAASSACTSQDLFEVFKGFIRAWNELEPLLQKPGALGAPPGASSVYAPAIVLEARAKGIKP